MADFKNIDAMIPLAEVVSSYMDEGEQSVHKEAKLWQLARRFMVDLSMSVPFLPRTIVLPVGLNKTAQIPEDCLMWIQVGQIGTNGELIALRKNKNLSLLASGSPNRLQNSSYVAKGLNISGDRDYWPNFDCGNGVYTTYYGVPTGNYNLGGYDVDMEQRLIVLPPEFPYSEVVLVYNPSQGKDGEAYIPAQMKEAGISWLRWKDTVSIPSSRRVNVSDKRENERLYYNDKRRGKAMLNPFNLQEAVAWNAASTRKVVKG